MDCKTLRSKLVEHSTLNFVTGKKRVIQNVRYVEPCGTPLFSDSEKQSGVCKGCASGWEVSSNRIVREGGR